MSDEKKHNTEMESIAQLKHRTLAAELATELARQISV